MTTILPFSNSIARKRQRSGISPVIASTVLIGITVVLGLALWSFANSGVGTATKEYADTVTDYGKFASDKFVVANMDFNNPLSNRISVWIYNSGNLATDFCAYSPTNPSAYDSSNPNKCATEPSIVIVCKDCAAPLVAPTDLWQHDPTTGLPMTWPMADGTDVPNLSVSSNQLGKFSFDMTSLESEKTYELKIISNTGASDIFLKKSG
jgi:flagellin-like protein